MQRPSAPGQAERAWLGTCLAALSLFGCASASDVAGTWRTRDQAAGALLGDGEAGVGVELVIAQYGPDVAGLVRFFGDATFDRPRDPTAPYFACACALLHKGRWDEAHAKITFELRGCLPGSSPRTPVLTLGQLRLEAQGDLVGTLTRHQPDQPEHGQHEDLRLLRHDTLAEASLRCDQYASDSDGNRASGR